MKNLFLISSLFVTLFAMSFMAYGQIEMNYNGKVSIGNYTPSSSYDLTLGKAQFRDDVLINPGGNLGSGSFVFDNTGYYGSPAMHPYYHLTSNLGTSTRSFNYVYSDDFINVSDKRLKENIRDINNSLGLILQIKGVRYDMKKTSESEGFVQKLDSEKKEKYEKKRLNKIGFLAQDVEKVIPEVVIYDEENDVYGIDYARMVPILTEAIKEQQLIIESLQSDIKKLEETINKSDTKLKGTISDEDLTELTKEQSVALYQNFPNPFNENTVIEYYLSERVAEASLNIYNMSGTQLKSIEIHHKGYGNIILNANEFEAGMYMYTLISNDRVVDTKQMILTD